MAASQQLEPPHYTPLKADAAVSTYRIDRLLMECDPVRKIVGGHAHYELSTARAARHAFNHAAAEARLYTDPRLALQFDRSLAAANKLFRQLQGAELLLRPQGRPPEFVAATAIASTMLHDERIYGTEAETVDDELSSLAESINRFLARCHVPLYKTSRGGNRDRFPSIFIDRLANDCRLRPFTPVTGANYRRFARLAAAGWEDLGLPRDYGNGRSYQSLHGWLADRVRTQLGFRSSNNLRQNPKLPA